MRPVISCFVAFAFLIGGSSEAEPWKGGAWPIALRTQMLRLAEVDWRLRLAARDSCPRKASGIGIMIDYREAYPATERRELYKSLKLRDLPQVIAVASDSPAALAGLRPGDEILSLSGKSIAQVRAVSSDSELLAEDLMDVIDGLPANVPTLIELRRGKISLRKTVVPVALCAGRTVLKTDREVAAYGDNHNIAVTSPLIDLTKNDDELALVIGHELAHIILEDTPSGQLGQSLNIERAVDLVGATIGHCAGYDMKRAAAFWRRFESQDDQRGMRMKTHPSPSEREAELITSITRLACPVSLPQPNK